MSTRPKTAQLQIRVSPAEKAAIQRAARRAGLGVSAYVLNRLLPAAEQKFHALTGACAELAGARFALAELNSFLSALGAGELRDAVTLPPAPGQTSRLANYIAAMVESACARRGIAPPAWTVAIPPLAEPSFGTDLESLRLHLLTHSPPPFRRRNIFIDASVGAQV
jgi:hypothetical protein